MGGRDKARYNERRAAGLCVACGDPADLNLDGNFTAYCPKCAGVQRANAASRRKSGRSTYLRRRREGVCAKCGKNPPAEGRAACESCLEARRNTGSKDMSGLPLVDRLESRLTVSGRLNLSHVDSREVIEAIKTLHAYASALERQGVAQGSITRLRKGYDIESIVGTSS